MDIPVIDIGPLLRDDADAVVQEIWQALRQDGFFYVTGYDVINELATKLFQVSETFFDLPDDVKNAISIKNSKAFRGYVKQGDDVTCSQADVKEGIYFGHEEEIGKEEHGRMRGTNQYPPEECVPCLAETVNTYLKQMTSFGDKLIKTVGVSIGQSKDFFKDSFATPFSLLALWRYPPHPENSTAWGIGPHTDYGVFTFVVQDDVGGLQVQKRDGTWIDMPPRPETLAVLIGNVVEIRTRGLLKATKHRVKNSPIKTRFSAAFFYQPSIETIIAPLDFTMPADFDVSTEPEQPSPFQFGEYVYNKFKASLYESSVEDAKGSEATSSP